MLLINGINDRSFKKSFIIIIVIFIIVIIIIIIIIIIQDYSYTSSLNHMVKLRDHQLVC